MRYPRSHFQLYRNLNLISEVVRCQISDDSRSGVRSMCAMRNAQRLGGQGNSKEPQDGIRSVDQSHPQELIGCPRCAAKYWWAVHACPVLYAITIQTSTDTVTYARSFLEVPQMGKSDLLVIKE